MAGTIARLDSASVLNVADGHCYGLPHFAKSNAGPAAGGDTCVRRSVSVSPCFKSIEEPPMKSRLLAAALAVGLVCICSQANAAGLLNILGGGYGGGCGCDAAPSCGCNAAPSCGCNNSCGCHQRCGGCFSGLFSHGCGCQRSCGCNNSCGCTVAAPSCAAPAPSCGCDNHCGCNRGCGCRQRCGCYQRGGCHNRCGCQRSCGCNNSCGCAVAAPSCGCGY